MAYKYTIDGKTYKSETKLSDDDLEELAGGVTPPEPSQPPKEMTFGEATVEALPAILGTAAPIAANVLAPGLALPFTAGFAGAGAAGGEALRQWLQDEEVNPNKMINEATLGVAGEGAGALIAKAAPSFVAGAKSVLGLEKQAPDVVIPLAERAAAQQTAKELGVNIPSSRVGGNFSQLLEGMSRAGVGEGAFVAADKQIATALRKEADNIVEDVTTKSLADIDVGNTLRASLEGAEKAFKDKIAPIYGIIEQKGGNLPVFVPAIKIEADKIITKAMALSRTNRTIGINDESLKLLKDLSSTNTTLTFTQAHEMRSNLLSMQRDLGTRYEANTTLSKYLNDALNTINKQMDLAADSLNPQLKKLYSGTNAEYKRVIGTLYDDTVTKILNKNPERLGEALAQTGNVTEVLKVRKAIREAGKQGQNVKVLEENLLQGYLKDVTSKLDDSLDSFSRLNDKLSDRKFKRTYDVMMQINPNVKANIAKLMNTAKIASKGNEPTILQGRLGAGGLTQSISLLTGTGAGLGYASGVGIGTGVAVASGVITAQGLISKILTSPAATNALLAAERISQKRGIEEGLKFLSNAKPIRRIIGQESVRSEGGRDVLKPQLDLINQIPQ